MRYILIFLLITAGLGFGLTEQEKDRLLMLIQGLFKDRVYSLSAKKAQEYLDKTDPDDPYREKVFLLQLQAYIKEGDREKILSMIDSVNKYEFREETRKRVYATVLNVFEENPDDKAEVLKRIIRYTQGYERKQLLEKLASIYYRNKKWAKILELPPEKELNLIKLMALYKMGRYMDVIKETERMKKYLPDQKDDVLYYRALAFFKLGREDKAASYMEAITFKTPEVIKFLSGYYFKRKKYLLAEKYLKLLSIEKGYQDYAFYMLGVIEDQEKRYKKAAEYYKRAAEFDTKYGKLANKRINQLRNAGVIGNKGKSYYSVRVILFYSQKKAKDFIKKYELEGCFIRPYKKYIAVYCGSFDTKKEAVKEKKKLIRKGFKDIIIEKIKI